MADLQTVSCRVHQRARVAGSARGGVQGVSEQAAAVGGTGDAVAVGPIFPTLSEVRTFLTICP